MKKLFILMVLFSLTLMGCEKKDIIIAEEGELCWECITRIQENYSYCSGSSGPAQYSYVIDSEMLCGFTAEQIATKESVNSASWIKSYDCDDDPEYRSIRYERSMKCTLLEE